MIWGKRRFAGVEYIPAMDLLEKLLMANRTLYREFMMVSVKASKFNEEDFYIGVPNRTFLAMFEGFDPTDEAALPKTIDTLHVADVTEFESRFEFTHNRVR